MAIESFDVVIVGAGISGLSAAWYLRKHCPELTFTILEGRPRIGGTWDLFRYPGIRSDSDMYTLGYTFRPWAGSEAIASGPEIRAYLEETAQAEGIAPHIRFQQRVIGADWSSAEARWALSVRDESTAETRTLHGRFLWACTGYYRYDEGYTPDFDGLDDFEGPVVHRQHWPEDLDLADRSVVVVGSGATAVSLVPELVQQGARVTMLQRTPTYVVGRPTTDPVAQGLRRVLPAGTAHRLIRWKNIVLGTLFYRFTQRFPDTARRLLQNRVARVLGDDMVRAHFTPPYPPWDQRLCLVANDDLFEALQTDRADIVTDHIDRITPRGVALTSGDHLDADVLVTATGLQMQFLGGAALTVDGQSRPMGDLRLYRGCMLSDVPNLAVVIGYINASWTLKCELVCDYVARVLRHMTDTSQAICVAPRAHPDDQGDRPAMTLSSGYVARAEGQMPTQGTSGPWQLHHDYLVDWQAFRRDPVVDGVLTFSPRPTP